MHRRQLEKAGIAAGLGLLGGCPPREAVPPLPLQRAFCGEPKGEPGTPLEADYVVVGSGAGGGPVACNLARAGYSVVLLEAGSDPQSWTRTVPALHAAAAEDPAMSWDFFVRTYSNAEQQTTNSRYLASRGGVLYPRAGTLGGCTAHNALITVCPHESDWDAIAHALGDDSWRGANMRKYFERLERCGHSRRRADNPSRHGYDGWLPTEVADPWLGLTDGVLTRIVESAVEEAAMANPAILAEAVGMVFDPTQSLWDPNDYRVVREAGEGVVFVPLHMDHGVRAGTREYVKKVQESCGPLLTVELDALASRIVFDGKRAVGVEYLKGARLYRATPNASTAPGEARLVRARREVILCGGVFNSPQLLMLSGIGPREQLARWGIEPVKVLSGVGKNLQDRYEVGVVHEMAQDFEVLRGIEIHVPEAGDAEPAFARWQRDGKGPYGTNGVVCALIKRSKPEIVVPDLFLFGLVGNFHGYYPGYSSELVADKKHFTWGVLKAHTHNTAGEVRLSSADPRDPPDIDFHYFDGASAGNEQDLDAVVEGVLTARRMMRWLGDKVAREVLPGPEVATREQIAQFVRSQAWGHHASCTNKMGPGSDDTAVVDGRFRVHGVEGLRVVDASVFPRIPGFFIVSAVYMIAEKATDVILEDARSDSNEAQASPVQTR